MKYFPMVWGCVLWCILTAVIADILIHHQFMLTSPFHDVTELLKALRHIALLKSWVMSGILSGVIILIFLLILHQPRIPNIYGNARFANFNEIQKSGLFAKEGILLGKAFGKPLRLDGFEHVILFAPTGTGKTTTLTIPNLLSWQDSCIVNDIKLQLHQLTAQHRESMGHKIFLWNPGAVDGNTHAYNPLALISTDKHKRIDDIQKIASIFIPDNPHSDPIWAVQSRFLLVALVLYVLDTSHLNKTIYEVTQLVKASPNFQAWIEEVLMERHDLDVLCRNNFMKFAELPEKTRLSILATFQSYFELFDNPLVVAATRQSDFDIRQLRSEKMTIYVGVTNDNLVRFAPLLTIFYQQVTDVMTRQLPSDAEPYSVLLLMDEFSALKRMESLQKNMGLFREYHVRVFIMVQELSQLYEIYGKEGAKVFLNAKVRMAFTQNDAETCQLISSMLGNTTITVKHRSKKLSGGLVAKNEHHESIHYAAKPLISAQEIRLLDQNKAIIVMQGCLPLLAQKML